MAGRPQPKEMAAPSGSLKTSNFSIKKALAPKEDSDEGVDLSNMPREAYSFDDLKMAWRRFAFEMKSQGKRSFFSALTRREPIFKEADTYILEVDNQSQVDSIKPEISELLNFVRKTVRNYDIMVQIELTQNPEEETKFLTGKDKFAKMARKNPNLHTLKNTFNLDIEY